MRLGLAIAGTVLLTATSFVDGQPAEGGPFRLTRSTIDGGGGASEGG